MTYEDESGRRNRRQSWWKQRTKMERRTTIVLIVALLIIIGLVIGIVVTAVSSGKSSACLTKSCVQQAAHLLKRMDTSVNPCDNFYDFVCGNYIKETELPEDKPELDPLSITGDLLNKQIRNVITEKGEPDEIRPFTLLRKFYATCMNTSAIEQRGVEQIKAVLSNFGGWPILEESSWIESSWIDISLKLRQYGFSTFAFIAIDSDINPKNSSEYIISVDQPQNEEIGEDNLKDGLKDDLVKEYANFLIDLAVLFGANKEFATKEIHDVIEFRAKIANVSVQRAEHLQLIISAPVSYVFNLQKNYPTIDWLYFINGVMDLPNKTISEQTKVVLVVPAFIAEFEKLISTTPKRVLANHALLQVIRTSIKFLPKRFRDREQKFLAATIGLAQSLPRWSICVSQTTLYFNLAADAMYVRRYVDEQARTDVTKMVSDIKDVFIKILKDVEWMDKDTKQKAIEKAEKIKSHIAYPEELLDNTQLEDYYSQIKFDSESIMELVSEVAKFKRDQALRFYGGPVVKIHWTTRLAATTNNAVYDPQTNSIQIPSGIMQNEFYNKDRPQYMNYGGLGLVIGHEITHGFDDTGKAFDKDGNALDWWESTTLEAYSSKSRCFVQQYGNFSVRGVKAKLNGENTLSENIADNGGIKEAYLAYLEWIKQHKEELPLPTMGYSSKQLFWISLANAWCSKIRTEALEQVILGDEHSPNEFRILGGLSNMQHFSKDFNCPVGSKMNPARKCQIW